LPDIKEESARFDPVERARAKLFTHGGSQAVRLPKAFRFEGAEVHVYRDGDRVILEPVRSRLPVTEDERAAFWARIDALRGDLMLQYPPRVDDFFGPDPSPLRSDPGDDDKS